MEDNAKRRQDLANLEALAGAPDDGLDAVSRLVSAGVDEDAAREWLLEASAQGLVAEAESGVVPQHRPTALGRELLEEAHERRRDRSYMRQMARRRLLAWADDTDGGNVLDFLESDHASLDGRALTFAEAVDAVLALHEDGLVRAETVSALGAGIVRADVEILPRGREVIDDFGGDPAAWRAAMANPSIISVQHNAGSIAVGGAGATVSARVTQGVDSEMLAVLVEALSAARGALALAPGDGAEYEVQLDELQSGEPSRVRRALGWFGRLGRDISTNALGGVLAGQALGLLVS